jgi:hypothetical protein
MPLPWLSRAAKLPGTRYGLHVGVLLFYRHGLEKGKPLKIAPQLLEMLGINRHAYYRALQAMEAAGLISVQRRRGKKPFVTIIGVPDAA